MLTKIAGAGTFALLTGLAAQISVPTPPDGIPTTLQTLVVVLAAAGLGAKWGTASMLIYIAAGILGAPLFAERSVGLAVILGQTGGYIVGFVLCQPVVHWLVRDGAGKVRAWPFALLAGIAAHAIIFAIGVPWLWFTHCVLDGISDFTPLRAIQGGLFPFIPGTIIKSALAAAIIWYFRPVLNRDR